MRTLLAATALCLSAPALADHHAMSGTQTEQGRQLTFEKVFGSPSLNGSSPRAVKLSPDGRYLTVLRNREDDKDRYDLWAFDRQTGDWRMLVDSEKVGSGAELSEAEKMQRERARIGTLKGIVTYQWSDTGDALLVPLDGDLYLAGLDGTVTRLTETEEGELNPTLSPKGEHISFVRDRQLYVGKVGEEPQPITPQEDETVLWGEAEFVVQEELDRMTGFWWSPDERRIAVQRTDEAPVGIVTRASIGATGTKVFDQRYPATGTPNAEVRLFVMDPDGKNRVEVPLGEEEFYLARVDWSADGKTMYVQRLDRAQSRLDMLTVDPATGKSQILFTERAADDHWINLTDSYKIMKDGSILWRSERDGFGHLYRFADGKWTQLTKGNWVVTDLDGVDQDKGLVYFTANKDDVLATQAYRLSLANPSEIVRLTDPAYVNSVAMDGKAQTLLVSRNSTSQPTQSFIADTDGKRITWIEENTLDAGHPYAPYVASHVTPEYGTLKAADGQVMYWRMLKPKMEPGKKYPVFFQHYGGPHVQVVTKGWGGALEQAIVDAGYIHFTIDNRGSYNRGVAFEKPIYRAMGTVEVEDQKVGAEYLKTLPFVDPAKIATYGWSYGGYMTLAMLEADPGLYAAGISGAPVTKWELYDTAYTERYMGTPQDEPEAYKVGAVIEDSVKITDPLLLIHGMADDNVVFENSSELIATMQGANVPFEMMLYPGQTHGVGGPKISPHLWYTIMNFLERHGVTPPE
ncbi:S9 family peptidase [Qipengyuania oceanensis]|uniref:Prolyl oligopeptidase family serine peptidase n=1 Tax=Qipengyuania oceanensis TaxID=1463597 RepID=A0A844YFT4_9SPHN|nr:S9 family peptidase [Qipengyuania oceanensis]MXO61918.1 prolyl oligopeptidase family serine peptidase [Qipengyuania oceanensis]